MRIFLTSILCAITSMLFSQFTGTYILNTSNTQTLQSFLADMTTEGVSGPVKILLEEGTYILSGTLDPIPGTSTENYITIRPVDPVADAVVINTNADLMINHLTLEHLSISDMGNGSGNSNGLNFTDTQYFVAMNCTFLQEESNSNAPVLNLNTMDVNLSFDSCDFYLSANSGIRFSFDVYDLPIYITHSNFFNGGRIEGAGYYNDCTFDCSPWEMFAYSLTSSTFCIENFTTIFTVLYLTNNTFYGGVSYATMSPQFIAATGNLFNLNLEIDYLDYLSFSDNEVTGETNVTFCNYSLFENNHFGSSCYFVFSDYAILNNNVFAGELLDINLSNLKATNNCFSSNVSISSIGANIYFNNFNTSSTFICDPSANDIAFNNIYNAQFIDWTLMPIHDNNYFNSGYTAEDLQNISNDAHPYFFDPMYVQSDNDLILSTNPELTGKALTIGTNVNLDILGMQRPSMATIGANEICLNELPDSLHLNCSEGLYLVPCNTAGYHFEPSDLFNFNWNLSSDNIIPFQDTTIYLYHDDVIIDSILILTNGIPIAEMSITNTTGLLFQFENISTCAATYQWSFGDGIFDNSFSTSHTYSLPGNYEVQLIATNQFGSDTTYSNIVVIADELFENRFSNHFAISPNPCSQKFTTTIPLGIHTFRILDNSGKLQTELRINSPYVTVDVSHFDPGIYFLQLIGNNNLFTSSKLVVLPD